MSDNEQSLQAIMESVHAAQQEMMLAQSEIAETEVTGSAGGGMVTVTMNGTGALTSVRFEQSVVDEGDAKALAGLTLTALRHATDEIKVVTERRMSVFTDGLGGGREAP